MSLHYRQVKAAVKHLIFTFLAVGIIATPLSAQQTTGPQQPRITERERRRMDMEDRIFALRMLEKEAHKADRPAPTMDFTYLQIRKDFEQLQVVNFNIVQMLGANIALDHKQLGEAASEIKKRASRLKRYLILPEPEKGEKPLKVIGEINAEQLPLSWRSLDALIMSFVNNSMFQNPKVVDLKLASQARRDLEEIIMLSGHIKKSIESFSKTK